MTWTKKDISGEGGASSLSQLQDIDLGSPPADGQVLTFDAVSSKWKPSTVSSGGSGLVSPWSGKKWLAIGDSVTQSAYNNTGSAYHKFVADQIGCTVVNEGRGGWGYFNAANGKHYTRIDGNNYDLTSDFATVYLGTNDWWQSGQTVPLTASNFGVLGDSDKTATFYGAVDYTLKQLSLKLPGKPIGVITPMQRTNSWGEQTNGNGITLTQVVDAIIQVSRKYSMPVLDLYRESNFYVWDNVTGGFNKTYYPDGLHPNEAGHRILARKILSFINQL